MSTNPSQLLLEANAELTALRAEHASLRQERDRLHEALTNTIGWLRGWQSTRCRSDSGDYISIILMNPGSLHGHAEFLERALAPLPASAPTEEMKP